ncbi:hypothetical protein [Maledivibacter halophilus]|nr:hypothetical protein [Maledivibacter halophilus]
MEVLSNNGFVEHVHIDGKNKEEVVEKILMNINNGKRYRFVEV